MKTKIAAIAVALTIALAALAAASSLPLPPSNIDVNLPAVRADFSQCDPTNTQCTAYVLNGPENLLPLICTPEQATILTDGRPHDVVLALVGTAVGSTPVTDLWVKAILR